MLRITKRRVIAILIITAGAFFCAALLLSPWTARSPKADFDRIRPGMTPSEVKHILGPPGDYRTRSTRYDEVSNFIGPEGPLHLIHPWAPEIPHDKSLCWQDNNAMIMVYFKRDKGVVAAYLSFAPPAQGQELGIVERIVRPLKREWRRVFPGAD